MAQKRSKVYGFKVISILDGKGKCVLQRVLDWGTPTKPPSATLDEYLNRLSEDSTANYRNIRLRFNKTELQQLHQCPSFSHCDITLLFKAIKLSCENVAGFDDLRWVEPSEKLEYYLTCIKNKRNEVFHGEREMNYSDFLRETADLRELLVVTLSAAGLRYGRRDEEVVKEIEGIHREIDSIMEEVLGEEELLEQKGKKLTQDFIEEADCRLRQMLEETLYLDPMSFLTGSNLRPHVHNMFCNIGIKQSQGDHEVRNVEYPDLLTFVQGLGAPHPEESHSTKHTPSARGRAHSFLLGITSTLRRFFKGKKVQQGAAEPVQPTATTSCRPQMLLVQGVAGSGKTTLVSFIMAEYMKGAGERILRGLEHYDLLLLVQCRDHYNSSFSGFLQQLMPEQFLKYRNILLPLFKRCRVIVLIDGLDEANINSERLVHSILHEAKDAPGFTIVCMSRPEKVSSFLHKIPSQYTKIHMELTGIPESERLNFVLRYHHFIAKHGTGCRRNAADLQRIMEEIGSKEQFRLPLNLLFLTWIVSHDTCITSSTITQSDLYFRIHQLCQQKLLDRLSRSPSAMDRWTLEKNLQEVLQAVYRMCLVCLSRHQLSLPKDEENSLRSACVDRGLPHQEVLSAFLTFKSTWTPWGMQEQYSAPHKGLQDFYAALYVVPLVGKQDAKTIKDNILGPTRVDLLVFQYMLQHVAALLPRPVTREAAEQVVDLLRMSGLRYEDQWLDLIENTKADPAIVLQIARHFPVPDDIIVKDAFVRSYTVLLPHLPPTRVGIILDGDPRHVSGLLDALSGYTCTRLFLRHHFRYPSSTSNSDAILLRVLWSNTLEDFGGHLKEVSIAQLPASLRTLSVAMVGHTHVCDTLLALKDQATRLPLLRNLEVHIPLASLFTHEDLTALSDTGDLTALPDAGDLTALPDTGAVMIYLSGITDQDIPRACNVIGALQPSSGYMGISFPQASITDNGWKTLLDGLEQLSVRTVRMEAPADTLTNELRVQLRDLAKETLSCSFFTRTFEVW